MRPKRQTRRDFLKISSLVFVSLVFSKYFFTSKSNNLYKKQILYDEPYRPQFHLTPGFGWMNDPCGMVYYRGEYHLHYQANPDNPKGWGSQWTHAVSKDLVNWHHLTPSLRQDEKYGGCSTGSCVVDWNNTSGFQTGKEKVIVMVFTITNPGQTQGVAYSNNRGRTWERYPGNPVIKASDGNEDFRDPKIFWFESTGKWIMVVSRGYTAPGNIYQSEDLKNWEHIGKGPNGECPDMFRLNVPESKDKQWLYLCGDYPMAQNGIGAKYFIGNFDGKDFKIKYGPLRLAGNFFVGQSFSDLPSGDGRRIWIGWKWLSNEGPFGPWTGGFQTIPVELSLAKTDDNKLQLRYQPVRELKTLRTKHFSLKYETVNENCYFLSRQEIHGELFECIATFQLDRAKEFGLKFRTGLNNTCLVGYNSVENKIFFSDGAGKEKISQFLFPENNTIKLHLLIDRSVIDIFGNDGLTWNCAFFKADPQDQGIELYAKGGTVKLIAFDLWQLKKGMIS
jgi:fructan beta-fructosidase